MPHSCSGVVGNSRGSLASFHPNNCLPFAVYGRGGGVGRGLGVGAIRGVGVGLGVGVGVAVAVGVALASRLRWPLLLL
jgi:hypothetical protein